jgi:multisubunit Na+/H+ antiporter MnhB subunit
MKLKFDFKKFLISFILAFIVNIIVVYLWDLFFHGQGTFNLGFSLTVALALSVVLSFIDTK